MTLNEAIDVVLGDRADGMTSREIADEINRRKLYIKPSDGRGVSAGQVSARTTTKAYRDRYARDVDGRITTVGVREEKPKGAIARMLAAMSEKYGPAPETFMFGDGIDWTSHLEPIPLYVELPFWLMVPHGDLDVDWKGTTFRVNIMRPWMEVFAGEVLDSRKTVIHQGPWAQWEPPPELVKEMVEAGVVALSRPCKTVVRLNTRAHLGAFREIDPEKEPPRVEAEQRAYWASLCEAHIPVLNELIQRCRLATYDYFVYEVSAWDVPYWYLGYGNLGRQVTLLAYKEWDSKPQITKDGDKPEDPAVTETIEYAAVDDLEKISTKDATPGEFDLLDARNLIERGDYSGAVRRAVTAIEAVTEWALRIELEQKFSKAEVNAKLAASENDWPGRFRQWKKLAKPEIGDALVATFEKTRQLRHKIVHAGFRLTHEDRGEAEKCVDTGRWLYNKIERKSDRVALREVGGLKRSLGRRALAIRFPSVLDSNGITLRPILDPGASFS